MRRWARVLVLVFGGAAVAVGIEIAHPGSPWAPLAVIGGAIAAGELIELKPPLRAALPISFAFMVVLAREASVQDAALVLVVAELATFLVRSEPTSVEGRLSLFLERLVEGLAAVLVYHGMADALGAPSTPKLLFALVRRRAGADRDRRRSRAWCANARWRSPRTAAWLTSRSSPARRSWRSARRASRGTSGMGLWGPAVFTIPLLAAWYSYEHLEVIRRTYDQTIRALGRGARARRHGARRARGARRRHRHRRWGARWASRVTSSRSSRRPRCCTTSVRSASTSPTTVARPSRSRSRRPAPPSCAARNCSRLPATSSPPSGCRTARTCRRGRR